MNAAVSLFPNDQPYMVERKVIVRLLAEKIGHGRDMTIAENVSRFFTHWQITIPESTSAAQIADQIADLILADDVYDSEVEQAHRATAQVLPRALDVKVSIVGWIAGWAFQGFRFTGRACPKCNINPEAYGTGGGTRCIDTTNCGWWFCY